MNPYASPSIAGAPAPASFHLISSMPWPMRIFSALAGLALIRMTSFYAMPDNDPDLTQQLIGFALPLAILVLFAGPLIGVPWREKVLKQHPLVFEGKAVAGGLTGNWNRLILSRPDYLFLTPEALVLVTPEVSTTIPLADLARVSGGVALNLHLSNGEVKRITAARPGAWVKAIAEAGRRSSVAGSDPQSSQRL